MYLACAINIKTVPNLDSFNAVAAIPSFLLLGKYLVLARGGKNFSTKLLLNEFRLPNHSIVILLLDVHLIIPTLLFAIVLSV